jgi:subtilisin family serine protease
VLALTGNGIGVSSVAPGAKLLPVRVLGDDGSGTSEDVAAGIDWARERGLHKLSLTVFPHNAAAIALYRTFGFVEEGRLVKQYRRQSGELWDGIAMGLLL